jgi:EAL domain-containing protein (putative c-di-GMP-specific phosphodiesterase class I)
VKLDMSLVRGVNASAIRQRLIASLAALCKDLGMHVLAEGVETAEEHDAVRGLGCELLQGYLFARPGRPFPPLVRFPA